MKKYFQIKNDGLLVIEDLILMGSSTKRNNSSTIGQYGTGWKYGIAFALRNNIEIFIYSGLKKIEITTVTKYHRGFKRELIVIDGVETNMTTELGMEWTGWMAMREIISNAMDEPGYEFSIDGSILPEENKTVVFVQMCDELNDFAENFDNYFSMNRVPDYVHNGIKIFQKKEASPIVVYRKGIRCYDIDKTLISTFDIDFLEISIDENRLTTLTRIRNALAHLIHYLDSHEIVLIILANNLFELNLYPDTYPKLSDNFKRLIDEGIVFTTDLIEKFISIPASVRVSTDVFGYFLQKGWVENPLHLLQPKGTPLNFIIDKDFNQDCSFIHDVLSYFNITVSLVVGEFHNYYEEIRVTEETVYIAKSIFKYQNKEKIVYKILEMAQRNFFETQFKMRNVFNELN